MYDLQENVSNTLETVNGMRQRKHHFHSKYIYIYILLRSLLNLKSRRLFQIHLHVIFNMVADEYIAWSFF